MAFYWSALCWREQTWRKHVNLCDNLKRRLTASTESHTCPGLTYATPYSVQCKHAQLTRPRLLKSVWYAFITSACHPRCPKLFILHSCTSLIRQLYSDQNQQSNFSYVGNGSISTVSTDSPVVQLSFPPISLGTQPSCLFLFPLVDRASSPPLMTNTCKT